MTPLQLVRRTLWSVVGVAAVLLVAMAGGWLVTGPSGPRPPAVAASEERVPIGGPFQMVDHRGRAVTEADFQGKPAVVFFGFLSCPDVCPTTLSDVTRRIEALGPDADRLAWLFATVDPGRDTPEAMAAYLSVFDSRITGLTGTAEQSAAMVRTWRAYAKRAPLTGCEYTMDHTAMVFLMDAKGRVRRQPGPA